MVVRRRPENGPQRFEIRDDVAHVISGHPVVEVGRHDELVCQASPNNPLEDRLRVLTRNGHVGGVHQTPVPIRKRHATRKEQVLLEMDIVCLTNGVALLATEHCCQIRTTRDIALRQAG